MKAKQIFTDSKAPYIFYVAEKLNYDMHIDVYPLVCAMNVLKTIGITHVFHALTFSGSLGSCLNTRPSGLVFKHRLRDPASVNAMKQTFVFVILIFYLIST